MASKAGLIEFVVGALVYSGFIAFFAFQEGVEFAKSESGMAEERQELEDERRAANERRLAIAEAVAKADKALEDARDNADRMTREAEILRKKAAEAREEYEAKADGVCVDSVQRLWRKGSGSGQRSCPKASMSSELLEPMDYTDTPLLHCKCPR